MDKPLQVESPVRGFSSPIKIKKVALHVFYSEGTGYTMTG